MSDRKEFLASALAAAGSSSGRESPTAGKGMFQHTIELVEAADLSLIRRLPGTEASTAASGDLIGPATSAQNAGRLILPDAFARVSIPQLNNFERGTKLRRASAAPHWGEKMTFVTALDAVDVVIKVCDQASITEEYPLGTAKFTVGGVSRVVGSRWIPLDLDDHVERPASGKKPRVHLVWEVQQLEWDQRTGQWKGMASNATIIQDVEVAPTSRAETMNPSPAPEESPAKVREVEIKKKEAEKEELVAEKKKSAALEKRVDDLEGELKRLEKETAEKLREFHVRVADLETLYARSRNSMGGSFSGGPGAMQYGMLPTGPRAAGNYSLRHMDVGSLVKIQESTAVEVPKRINHDDPATSVFVQQENKLESQLLSAAKKSLALINEAPTNISDEDKKFFSTYQYTPIKLPADVGTTTSEDATKATAPLFKQMEAKLDNATSALVSASRIMSRS